MSGKATTDPYPLPKEAKDAALVLKEALRLLAGEGHSRLVVQLALATWVAEILAQQAPKAGDDDRETALLGLLFFVGYVVKGYQELTGHDLPPFTLGLVAKSPQQPTQEEHIH